jgi:hypothetical protein
MFCPKCRAEYRPGFSQCSDCELELIAELPPKPPDPVVDPTEFPSKEFLLWFVPLACLAGFLPFFLITRMNLTGFHHPLVVLTVIVHIVVPIGGWWLIYQAIRYEARVGRYILLAFVPFGFLWYRLVRYPHRPKLVRVPCDGPPDGTA